MVYQGFGKLIKDYAQARQGYVPEIFDYLKQFVSSKSLVLDLGCGTGISTRQLVDAGFRVVGSDIDKAMVNEAKKFNSYNIDYFVAPSQALPFKEGNFSTATAFGAFHWFADDKSISEIKRVLKRGGYFFVVNKTDTGNLRKDFLQVLKDFEIDIDSSSPK